MRERGERETGQDRTGQERKVVAVMAFAQPFSHL